MEPALLRARARCLSALRRWFDAQGYLEVHTPTIVPTPAMEEHLEPVCAGDAFLHTSPELAMKRVLAAGLHRIYQICPCFRAEEQGVHHRREFTMLEWYRAGAGTPELMDDTEDLIAACAEAVGVPAPRFARVPVSELIDPGLEPDAWFFRWVDEVEPRLSQPTIVYGYPAWQAALATVRDGVADRFEVYLGGLELANAFAEEADPDVIRARFAASATARAAMGRRPHAVDERFLAALPAMPRCAGIAMGVDRLVMALTGAKDIAAVVVP